MKRCNEIGVLPVTLYGKCYATGEPIETDWQDRKREEVYIRKDKAISNDDEGEEDEGKKRSVYANEVSRMKRGMKEKSKNGEKKTTEGNREAVVAEFCSRTTVVGGAVHIRGKLYPGYCSLAVSVLR